MLSLRLYTPTFWNRMTRQWIIVGLVLSVLFVASGDARQQQPPDQDTEIATTTSDGDITDDVSLVPGETLENPDQQAPIFRSGINYVRVDATVTDQEGNSVLDLAADDFEIYEDGIKQEIDSFQLVQVDQLPSLEESPLVEIGRRRSDQERAASQADVRVFVIFLDDYHVRQGNSFRARQLLVEFLENSLIPTDLVGVMFPLMPLEAVRLTRNHQAVINAIDSFEGVKYRYDVRNQFESAYNHYPTEIVERMRNDVSLSALKGLMIYLGSMREGRKSVLLVSEGYSNYVPPQMRAMNATTGVDPAMNPARYDPFAGNGSMEEVASFFQQDEVISDLRRVFQTATRFNTSIYTLDPRGLAVQEFDVSGPTIALQTDARQLRRTQDTLRILSEETDGRAIINQNDFGPGLQQMLDDSNAYYLLGYNSTLQATDGEFHEIEVRVGRPQVNLRARKGYWAITELDIQRSLRSASDEPPRAVDVALGALSEQRRGQLVRTWFGSSRADNGKTRITFVWEPVLERGRRSAQASRVLVTAMGNNGDAYFRGRVPESVGPGRGTTGDRNTASGSSEGASLEFEADPGVMQISLAIEGDAGEVLDRDRNEISVPDFTAPEIVFSTPSFIRARNALEYRELSEDWTIPPTASRNFRRTDYLIVRFNAYAPGDLVPEVHARLLNRRGDVMFPLTLRPASDGQPYQVEFLPSFLAPGEYLIELTAETPESEAIELLAFRLGA